MENKNICDMGNKELLELIMIIREDLRLKDIKTMTLLGKYPELKEIVIDLYNKDNLYKEIAVVPMLLASNKNFNFRWHKYICDKDKNKDLYDLKISGRDLNIFISYLSYYLRSDFKDYDITQEYLKDYSLSDVNDLPYGFNVLLSFLSKRKVELQKSV